MRRVAAVAALTLSACGSSEIPQAAPLAHRPYRDLPELVTTTTVATTTTHTHPVRVSRSKARARVSGSIARPVSGDIWAKLAACESSDGQDSASGKYHGWFQFSLATWGSVGEIGDPHTYSYEHQRAAAIRLQARSGWGQWPRCSRRLGLR